MATVILNRTFSFRKASSFKPADECSSVTLATLSANQSKVVTVEITKSKAPTARPTFFAALLRALSSPSM